MRRRLLHSLTRTLAGRAFASVWTALAGVLAGCGGDQDPEAAIRATVKTYLLAAAERDDPRACAQMTENGQLGVFEFRRVHIGTDHPASACASAVERFGPERGLQRLRDARVSAVSVEDETATASVSGSQVTLRRQHGRWLIDTFGLAYGVSGDTPPAIQ